MFGFLCFCGAKKPRGTQKSHKWKKIKKKKKSKGKKWRRKLTKFLILRKLKSRLQINEPKTQKPSYRLGEYLSIGGVPDSPPDGRQENVRQGNESSKRPKEVRSHRKRFFWDSSRKTTENHSGNIWTLIVAKMSCIGTRNGKANNNSKQREREPLRVLEKRFKIEPDSLVEMIGLVVENSK